jgi:hypothetical protein
LEATGGTPGSVSSALLTNFGVVEAGANSSLTLSGLIVNAGIFESVNGGSLTINGTLVNIGLIEAKGGNVTVGSGLIGGAAQIYSASKMEFLGASTDIATSFQNNAGDTSTLILDKPASFNGPIAGFFSDGSHSDTLDLKSIIFASGDNWSFTESANGKQGTLTISDHNGDTAKLTLQGKYLAGGKSATSTTSSIFHAAADGAGASAGTLLTTSVI